MSLEDYRRKRNAGVTPEPMPRKAGRQAAAPRFVIQKHDASRLHYDLRLEHEGVLASWAVPKGLATPHDPRKLSVQVEDHPLEYLDFHGEIPKGEYGAGQVDIWDTGTYEPLDDFATGLEKGKLTFRLLGEKVDGEFSLVRMKQGADWLILLHKGGRLNPDLRAVGRLAAQPRQVEPMKAMMGDKPFDSDDFSFEIKFDGIRAVAFLFEDGATSLRSRNHKELSASYPELEELGSHFLARELVVDGEIVALDERGVSSFQLLQSRMNLGTEAAARRAAASVPVYYYLFDVLYLDGRDLTGLPLSERRQILERIFIPGKYIRLSESVELKGRAFFQAAAAAGLEGIMAKRKASPYLPKRTLDWIKLKAVHEQEFVIGGYTTPRGGRTGFGALLVGYHEGSRLVYAGHVGTGFSEELLADLMKKMNALKQSKAPFTEEPHTNQPATWIKPRLVAEIKFAEWTRDGVLREPVFLGLRTDKKPREVVREEKALVEKSMEAAEAQDRGASAGGSDEMDKPKVAAPLPRLSGERQEIRITGRRLALTHLDKVFWPDEGYTKRDLIDYYHRAAGFIVPHLEERPLTLKRYPDGFGSQPFFEKEAPPETPDWVRTETLAAENERKKIRYILCEDEPTLLYLANIACISQNPWLSKLPDAGKPDVLVLDIDPPGPGRYDECIEVALLIRETLADFGLKGYPKTSGATGIHVYVPIRPVYTYAQVRQFAQVIASLCREQRPDLITLEVATGRRGGKIYLDFLQNVKGKTVASVYSVRAQPGAPVSTPLEWMELRQGLRPGDFTIANVPARLEQKGDLFAGVLNERQDLLQALKQGERLLKAG